MPSRKEFLEYVLEQLSNLENITYKQMMGEYIIYYKGKIAAYVCDDRLLIKPTPSAEKLMPNAPHEPPYDGAKDMILCEEIDDKAFLQKLFEKIYPELPEPKKERKMTAIEIINKRHSYRGKFKPTPVPRTDLITIMKAGLAAPSGCNKQTTSLIAVDDPEVMSKLHAVIDPPVGETAPAMICVLTKRIFAYRDKCYATQDYSAAIENMLLAAVELGYQSCWIEGHITDTDDIAGKMAKILNVPDEYELVCFLPIGIAESEPTVPKKIPFEERMAFNSMRNS